MRKINRNSDIPLTLAAIDAAIKKWVGKTGSAPGPSTAGTGMRLDPSIYKPEIQGKYPELTSRDNTISLNWEYIDRRLAQYDPAKPKLNVVGQTEKLTLSQRCFQLGYDVPGSVIANMRAKERKATEKAAAQAAEKSSDTPAQEPVQEQQPELIDVGPVYAAIEQKLINAASSKKAFEAARQELTQRDRKLEGRPIREWLKIMHEGHVKNLPDYIDYADTSRITYLMDAICAHHGIEL